MVVSDINMPGMDGLTLLAKLQEADDKHSTIIVSAYGDMANIRTAMNRGAFDFLTKPIDFAISKRPSRRRSSMSGDARGAPATGAGRAGARLPVTLFLAQPRQTSGRRRRVGMEARWREVASIFTDIAGFTSLVESLDPNVLGEMLNEYVGEMTESCSPTKAPSPRSSATRSGPIRRARRPAGPCRARHCLRA